jgi:hypothetical protein
MASEIFNLAWYREGWTGKWSKPATWNGLKGQDENDPAFGSGWLKLSGKDNSKEWIKFHLGDSSEFLAIRAESHQNPEL